MLMWAAMTGRTEGIKHIGTGETNTDKTSIKKSVSECFGKSFIRTTEADFGRGKGRC